MIESKVFGPTNPIYFGWFNSIFRFPFSCRSCTLSKKIASKNRKKVFIYFTKYFYFQHSIWTLHSTSNKSTIHFSKIFISVALGCFLLLVKDSHTYSSIKRRIPILVILKKGYLILANWYSSNWHSGKCCLGNMLFWQLSSRYNVHQPKGLERYK